MTESLARFILEQIAERNTRNMNRRRSCYFYHENQEMGTRVPYCNYYDTYGSCPCLDGKECSKYIDWQEVEEIIKEYVDMRDEDGICSL